MLTTIPPPLSSMGRTQFKYKVQHLSELSSIQISLALSIQGPSGPNITELLRFKRIENLLLLCQTEDNVHFQSCGRERAIRSNVRQKKLRGTKMLIQKNSCHSLTCNFLVQVLRFLSKQKTISFVLELLHQCICLIKEAQMLRLNCTLRKWKIVNQLAGRQRRYHVVDRISLGSRGHGFNSHQTLAFFL